MAVTTEKLETSSSTDRSELAANPVEFPEVPTNPQVTPSASLNSLMTSRCDVPLTGSPPIPTQVDWPTPREVSCHTAS